MFAGIQLFPFRQGELMAGFENNTIMQDRSSMRTIALNERNGLPENMRDAYSQIIRKKVVAYLESISAKFVHIYLNFGSEVGTRGIIEDLFERKIKVAVPVTRGEHLIHSKLENLDDLKPGKFGVPEPTVINEISPGGLDAVIIPLVAFDGRGMRLGYGKGFYDRFLIGLNINIKKVGIAFSLQELEEIPMLSHDQLMNSVITEKSHFIF
jgi:5-formyltetrahydrofolate cyclo-ligase